MKKYFSSIICSSGYTSIYNTIYKNDPSSKVFIAYGGDDYERATFFNKLIKNFKGYNLSVFNPFFDESPDGIYIENLNTYIISDSSYSRVSPILPGIWEKYSFIVKDKTYPLDLQREVLILKVKENNCYKNACEALKKGSYVKEKIHNEFSYHLNDEKVINYVLRFCGKHLKSDNAKGNSVMRLLSSPTPLGIHTHFDTIFESCENIIEVCDDFGFVGSIILGIIKDYAVSKKIPHVISPTYFANDILQTIIFPNHSLALIVCDENHNLPFRAQEKITISRFLTNENFSYDKVNTLKSIENKFLEDCVLNIYEGRDYRFKYNNLCNGYTNTGEAIESADRLFERLIT